MDTIKMYTTPFAQPLHRLSGTLLAAFLLLHLVNHALVMVDRDLAFAFMDSFRRLYRSAAGESLIVAAALVQMVTGPMLARLRPAHTDGRTRLARWSGNYLLFFLVVHLGAVFVARLGLGIDTDIDFAAAGLRSWPAIVFFLPYYSLAVIAVFVHIGLAISRRLEGKARRMAHFGFIGAVVAGVAMAGVIVGSLMLMPSS
jgi:succinate dehydrogenase/fumarate reductase cytochrome b subunit